MYIRFEYKNKIKEGFLKDEKIALLDREMLAGGEPTSETVLVKDVTILAPCQPSKVVCVGLNYKDHAKEMNMEMPTEPLLFLKPSTSVIGDGEKIIAPPQSTRLDYEGELAIVIGQEAKNIDTKDSNKYIFGYSCANDFTARDLQLSDGQWARGKSFDTFCPIGPGIVKTINENDAEIELRVNGSLKQKSNLNQLIFNVDEIVSYISKQMTLLPGDIILTGTPHGVGTVVPGDTMTVSITGIGTLTNTLTQA
ncbi:fumarylacetoacetate hydrolase family protein [Vreelandella maris]|uniref:Fumarylacetoacetate hydrolase family protein n=1 Tax=Vreelandella maris TaxID=2729617 RepID=A0A7Y6RFF9_9GAMM|nr:fumarylacetoacetate hydrolase family protein [Halomonas maris]NVF15818.1 fumarylacetoacetate hydrolase family protein [Halomonas maris]|tara:strand:- start:7514 stop:8269 length:756 start_codon:yes stop_codon:yes gene_type:complete